MDLGSIQKPLKEQYRDDPAASRITLKARGGQTETPIACSVAIGKAIYNAEAHSGVGGAGTGRVRGICFLERCQRAPRLRAKWLRRRWEYRSSASR